MGLQPSKLQKLVIFGIYLPKGVYPLKQFLQNLAWGRVSHVPIITLIFTFVAAKIIGRDPGDGGCIPLEKMWGITYAI